ncbi:MAG: hypothetical protein R6W76_22725 [Caldilinea sp.]
MQAGFVPASYDSLRKVRVLYGKHGIDLIAGETHAWGYRPCRM